MSCFASGMKSNGDFPIFQDGSGHFPGGNRKREGDLLSAVYAHCSHCHFRCWK